MSDQAPILTRATALSLVRLALAPALWWSISIGRFDLATLVFWLAVATDFTDGWVARRYAEVTPLGGAIDHAVDAAFVVTGTLALACVGLLPLALPPLIALAFLQYTADSRAFAAQGLRPSRLGRWNGIGYYVIVAVPIVRDTLGLIWPEPGLVMALGWLLVASTLLSMLDRFRWFVLARRAPGSPA